ncbi:hypothetical protein LJC74_09685, partial [Eubacteriales bacterium OttesenSCG-928-A19]|nr:hypothetical protein [Eubacteriales bacterium OttesenSCG-928-A19]
ADVPALMETLPAGEGERVVGIVPGVRPGWDARDRAALERLLGGGIPADALVGLLVAMPLPACGGGCGACCGTNGGCGALYSCNRNAASGEGDAIPCDKNRTNA